jgi:hypothetical protein
LLIIYAKTLIFLLRKKNTSIHFQDIMQGYNDILYKNVIVISVIALASIFALFYQTSVLQERFNLLDEANTRLQREKAICVEGLATALKDVALFKDSSEKCHASLDASLIYTSKLKEGVSLTTKQAKDTWNQILELVDDSRVQREGLPLPER